ncbi:MAG TPA: class I tRNA ligase family protein [Anaerolineaceae bacterium]|nr:class I tRNA ligase family protein [Anaerolineaceae bacterium]
MTMSTKMFKKASSTINFVEQEHEILEFWKSSDAFNKMRELHKGQPTWSFQDGPITANNPMGVHHGWGRTYKDVFNRFWTMRGRELRYQNGFDCQGLWVEVEVEKALGFTTKKDIEDYGLAKFVLKCKERVLRYAAVQTTQSVRLGYWMDWNDPELLREMADKLVEDPAQVMTVPGPNGPVTDTVEQLVGRLGSADLGGSYFTFSNENNYMIWRFLKTCWERGWLYQGADVMPWCPRCATGISQHEIVTDGYEELTHISVTLRFPLRGRSGESLLVWTTTPWTLTSNVAAAVGPELTYIKVKQGDEIFYLSKGTTHILKGTFEVLAELKGSEMEGWVYDGPFDNLEAANMIGGRTEMRDLVKDIRINAIQAHKVILWDDVGDTEGTGIVHIAPGCGAEDFKLGRENGFPMLAPLDEEGVFLSHYGLFTGMHVSEVAPHVFKALEENGRMYKVESYTHRYPTCWRCKTELVFRLVDEWYLSMGETYDKPREELTSEEKDRSLRYQIMDVVDQIRWIPEFGHARELDWLKNMHDWMISKKRYWGLALPIWVCDTCKHHEVIGDDIELKERAVEGRDQFEGHTPHRPYVDAIKISCPKCGALMNRISDVGNPWLDAGIVTFSTIGYRNDPANWRKWYPADWISESFPGQFRNWFYSLLVMATVLDNTPPFRQVFSYASLLAEDGREMHKSWGNSIEFNEAADKMGVDVMRWMYCSQKPENNLLFGYNKAEEVRRGFLIPLWNVYSFFVTYASMDGWQPNIQGFDPSTPEGATPTSDNPLDRWILARLNDITSRVNEALENSDSFAVTLMIEPFVEDLTNWYVRRSRRRFWKSEHDADKNTAYTTLYHVLVKFSRLLAPFVPFVTEVMYQNLVRSMYENAYSSIHQTSYPQVDENALDGELVVQMNLGRRIASLGLGARASANLKVRQPLSRVLVYTADQKYQLPDFLVEIIRDELNVKFFETVSQAEKLVSYRILPNNKLLGPRFGSQFPALKEALTKLQGDSSPHKAVANNKSIKVIVTDEVVELSPEEVLVETQPVEGLAVQADQLVTVAIDSVITPELKLEGLAREFVRRVQDLRKTADFDISDRIRLAYQASPKLSAAVKEFSEYIQNETLTLELLEQEPLTSMVQTSSEFDGETVTLGVEKIK